MADLSFEEKRYLENYLQMGSGYVLDFSNSEFYDFVYNKTKKYIDDEKYCTNGNSKARKLREFFRLEPNHIVSQLINAFIKYHKILEIEKPDSYPKNKELEEQCEKIIERLNENQVSKHIDNIDNVIETSDFQKLSTSIKNSIKNNEPEVALDRLHTYFIKYLRELLKQNKINFDDNETLNALFGKYIKFIETKISFETEMTKTILKTNISILDNFNKVRNNHSFAHANKLLNYRDSLFIFDSLARLKGYVDEIQEEIKLLQLKENKADDIFRELSF